MPINPNIFAATARIPLQEVNESQAPQAVKKAFVELDRWLKEVSRPLPGGGGNSSLIATAMAVMFQANVLPMPGDTLSLAQLTSGASDIGMGVRVAGQTAGVLSVAIAAATSRENRAMAVIQAIDGADSMRVVIAHMPLMVARVTNASIGDTVRQSNTTAGAWTVEPVTDPAMWLFPLGIVVGLNYGSQPGMCLVMPPFPYVLP